MNSKGVYMTENSDDNDISSNKTGDELECYDRPESQEDEDDDFERAYEVQKEHEHKLS